MDSEADLDAAIKDLLPLAQEPTLGYSELVRSGAIVNLIGLMSHENVDIVIDIVEVIHELTDEDVGAEVEDEDDDEEPLAGKKEESLKLLVDALVNAYSRLAKTLC